MIDCTHWPRSEGNPIQGRLGVVEVIDQNATVVRNQDGYSIVLSVDAFESIDSLEISVVHECCHVFQFSSGRVPYDMITPLEALLSEGLAVALAREVVPGYPAWVYLRLSQDAYSRCVTSIEDLWHKVQRFIYQPVGADLKPLFHSGESIDGLERIGYFLGLRIVDGCLSLASLRHWISRDLSNAWHHFVTSGGIAVLRDPLG